MKSVKKSISLPASLYAKAEERARQMDFLGLSDYVQHLIRKDAERQAEAESVLRETGPRYRAAEVKK